MNTLYDLVSRVLDARDGYNDPTSIRRALRAAIWGADQVTQRHRWLDYHTEAVHLLNAPVEIEASVTAAGVLTLDSGTLPSWAAQGSVKIDDRLHVVAIRNSDTVCTLQNYAGSAVASTTLSIIHDRLVLRDEVRQIYAVRNEGDNIDLMFVSPAYFTHHQVLHNAVAGQPSVVTTARNSNNGTRQTELRFSPAPSDDLTIRVSYFRVARKATVLHDCGLVTIEAGDLDLVTITNPVRVQTLFDLQLVLSGDASRPDADIGFGVVDDNPAVATLAVDSIASTTTLNLAAEYSAIESKGAMLTQLLDLPPHASEAAAMYAEAKYLQVGAGSVGDFWQAVKIANEEMITAMEQEATLARHSGMGSRVAIYTRAETLADAPTGGDS